MEEKNVNLEDNLANTKSKSTINYNLLREKLSDVNWNLCYRSANVNISFNACRGSLLTNYVNNITASVNGG